jgi:hypothetical protein
MTTMHRRAGRIWHGEGREGWSLSDVDSDLEHTMRYGRPDRADLLAAADVLGSYRHLLTYRDGEFVIAQLRAVRRFLKEERGR